MYIVKVRIDKEVHNYKFKDLEEAQQFAMKQYTRFSVMIIDPNEEDLDSLEDEKRVLYQTNLQLVEYLKL